MLTAFVLGYDVAARIAGGFTPRPLAHQNGQVSLLAAAAAGARLRGLDAAGISLAMRIATVLMLTPSYTNAVAGATTLNVAGGMSGFAAALAPELALAGFAAQPDAIEEALGNLVGDGFTPGHVVGRTRRDLAHHPQLFPALRVLQPDPPGARLPFCGIGGIAPESRPDRAHRGRDLPLCLGHAATPSRPIILPRNIRCRTPPR